MFKLKKMGTKKALRNNTLWGEMVMDQKDKKDEAGQLGLVPTRPLSQLGLGSTRSGQLGLFIFLMVNRDITMYLIRSLVDMIWNTQDK